MSVSVTVDAITRNVEVAVSNQRGPAGASGAFVNSATESDGTADLDLLNVTTVTATVTGTLTADHIHGNLAGSVYAHIRAGETLEKGDPVYVSGSHGSGSTLIPIVSKADASNAAKMPAIGIMDAAVANNATGHMVIVGTITELDTAGLTDNAELYVAAGGGFTATPPTARAQPVARVERANLNNGAVIVKVNGLSASDATGNTLVRRTSGGAASFASITLSGTGGSPFTSTLTGGVNFANRTLVLPDASGTLVTLGELANSATITASTAVANSTIVLRDSAGQISITNSNVAGTTAYASTAGWTYGTGAAAAHRTALGLGTGDLPTLRGLSLARDASNSVSVEVGGTGNVISTYVGTQPGVQHLATRDGTFAFEVRNTSTGNNANAVIIAQTLGLGDAYTRYTIPSGSWTAGLDNSDADKYKIGVGSTVNLETWFEISATGASRFFGSVDLQRTSDSTNFERLGMRWDGFDAKIGTSKGGTGGPRDLVLETDGTERARISAAGLFSVNGVSVGRGGGGISTNMAVGSDALAANTTGSNSLAVGQQSLIANTTGAGNCAVGGATLFKNTTGGGNTALGLFALFDNISSNDNTALGSRALLPATGGSNTAVGRQSLGNSTTGTSNTAIGIRSGNTIADGTTANAVTTNSIYVGSDTRALASGQTNQIVIGHLAIGAGSNSVTLGNDSVTLTQLKGNVVVQRGAQDTTNFERLGMRWDSTTAKVGTSKGGSGQPRDLALEADSIERLRVLASNGNVGLGTQAPASRLTVSGGDAEVTDSASGIILKSPDGTRWRVTISNLGILTTASITPP